MEVLLDYLISILGLSNYNTRLVVLSTMTLGMGSGLVGSFLLLRKRSLMGDVLSHACFPGIGIAFSVLYILGRTEKNLVFLLFGATISGVLGMFVVLAIRNSTKLNDDTAMGIVLSVFFGMGVAILGLVQDIPGVSVSGLDDFIYGNSASMIWVDFQLLFGISGLIIVLVILLRKEWTILCFDEHFTASLGWSVKTLDFFLLLMVTMITVVGLQAVGFILMIAFLVIPAAGSRFWTKDRHSMFWVSGLLGAISGWFGSLLSAQYRELPAGATIVLVASVLFGLSFVFGKKGGILQRYWQQLQLKKKIGRQHFMRAVFELQEIKSSLSGEAAQNVTITLKDLLNYRSWSPKELLGLKRQAKKEGHLEDSDSQMIALSEAGFGEAYRITRNHRLWELFLIEHADIATTHVDRDADAVEHILSPSMVRSLETQLNFRDLPDSPHSLKIRNY